MLTGNNDSHIQSIIKSENEKMYHFAAAQHLNKAQMLTDTKIPPPSQMFDVRNADGQIVHVNIEDINQFLTYHEVFGKISGAEHFPPASVAAGVGAQQPGTSVNQTNPQLSGVITAQQHSTGGNPPTAATPTPLIIPKIENIPSNINVDGNITPTCTTTNASTNNPAVNSTASTDDATAMPAPAVHTCDICGKIFPFKYQFIVHRRYHNERKPFICQVCGQAFTTSQDLTQHGKAHDGNKMFTCNICYNVFANDASLERHMKRHSTDKPFACTICQKTFARKEHLENHFRSHTGICLFLCEIFKYVSRVFYYNLWPWPLQ